MAKYLVIVESPTKARTISNMLGKDYEIESSMGHLVDLPTSSLSIDVEDGFKPTFRVIRGKEKTISLPALYTYPSAPMPQPDSCVP